MPWSTGLRGRFPWKIPRTHPVRQLYLRHTSSNLISTPAVRVRAEVLSPALSTGHSRKSRNPIPLNPAATLKSGRGSTDTCADEDEVNVTPPTPSLIYSVLGNFAFAVFLISLAVLVVFFAATWLTVFRDARSMRDQVLSDPTGVSLPLYFNRCALLTVAAALGISTRPRPSTRSRCICVVHFMEGRSLWCTHYPLGSTPVLRSRSRELQAVR